MRIFALLAAAAIVFSAAPPAFAAPQPGVSAQRISEHIRILASDAFEGRAPGTAGEAKTIDYIARQFGAVGLKPAGDKGGWTQAVPMRRAEISGPLEAVFATARGRRPLAKLQDIVIAPGLEADRVSIKDAPVVFIGYGVNAPERGWDDFKGYDLKGKVALVLVNEPDFEAQPGEPGYGKFDGKAITAYGRAAYKQQEAIRRGAVGVLVIHETGPAGYGWETAKNSTATARISLASEAAETAAPTARGWVQGSVVRDLFKDAGLDFDAEKARARSDQFRPRGLPGMKASIAYSVQASDFVSHNVIGRTVGAGHPREAVIYSAHWDHLGVGIPDAKGDRIYNGALDNASGVASLIELGRAFATAAPTDRSVYFIAFTGEESGLIGAAYYVDHPVVPLGLTAAVLNFDGANLKGAARDISSRGLNVTPLEAYLAAAAAKAGRRFTPDPSPDQGYFLRADQAPFARAGVPAIGYASGLDLEQGGVAAGRAWADTYVANRYHQPGDEWTPSLDLTGAAIDADIYYDFGRTLATSRDWPPWKPDSPYRAQRDQTAADRK